MRKNIGKIKLSTNNIEYGINEMDFMLLLLKFVAKYKNNDTKDINMHEILNNNVQNQILKEDLICEQFLKECIEKSTDNVSCVDVYDRYLSWSENNSERQTTKHNLFTAMKKIVKYNGNTFIGEKKTTGFLEIKKI